jgi:PKD repeat protein
VLEPEEWIWNFGDGNTTPMSSGVNVTHSYSWPAAFTPSLTGVNGTFSGTETKIRHITVGRNMPGVPCPECEDE